MELQSLKRIVEAALLAADRPLSLDRLLELFPEEQRPERAELRDVIQGLREAGAGRGVELVEVAGGFRFQVCEDVAPWVARLWEERPPRYSRAFLETLALIAYRQPITRGEIEDIRGVSVSTSIVKTLQERDWIRIVGHREVPGRPAMYGTTRRFLDDFNLKSLDELPTLAELRDLSQLNVALPFEAQQDTEGGPRGEAHADAVSGTGVSDDTTPSPDPAVAEERG